MPPLQLTVGCPKFRSNVEAIEYSQIQNTFTLKEIEMAGAKLRQSGLRHKPITQAVDCEKV